MTNEELRECAQKMLFAAEGRMVYEERPIPEIKSEAVDITGCVCSKKVDPDKLSWNWRNNPRRFSVETREDFHARLLKDAADLGFVVGAEVEGACPNPTQIKRLFVFDSLSERDSSILVHQKYDKTRTAFAYAITGEDSHSPISDLTLVKPEEPEETIAELAQRLTDRIKQEGGE